MQHMDRINTPCGQNTLFLNVTEGGTYSYRWILSGWGILVLCNIIMKPFKKTLLMIEINSVCKFEHS